MSSSGASVKVPITPDKSKSVDGFNGMSVEDAEFETSPDDKKWMPMMTLILQRYVTRLVQAWIACC